MDRRRPVDAADLLLAWAALEHGLQRRAVVIAHRRTRRTPTPTGQPDRHRARRRRDHSARGRACAVRPRRRDGALLDGYTYKEATGVAFDGSSESFQLVTTTFPVISDDGRSMTVDVRHVLRRLPDRRHRVGRPGPRDAENALGIEDPAEAKQALIDAFQDNDDGRDQADRRVLEHRLRRHRLPDDPGVPVSYGPYILTAYDESAR